jgi:hypothetical protein
VLTVPTGTSVFLSRVFLFQSTTRHDGTFCANCSTWHLSLFKPCYSVPEHHETRGNILCQLFHQANQSMEKNTGKASLAKLCLTFKFYHLIHENTKYVNIKSTTVYVPSSELGISQPLSRQRVCPSHQNRGGGHTRPRVRGWGIPNSHDFKTA